MDSADSLYSFPIEIASGIYWLGYAADNLGLHCNPYLILEGDEAVLIDGGSRDDFSNVMLKILRLGIKPSQITRLSTIIMIPTSAEACLSLRRLLKPLNSESSPKWRTTYSYNTIPNRLRSWITGRSTASSCFKPEDVSPSMPPRFATLPVVS